MFEWLGNNWLAIFGIVVSLISGAYFYTKTKPKKRLEYWGVSVWPILNWHQPESQGFTILFREVPVTEPFVTQLRITNTGNKEIAAADYERPLTITVDQALIIHAQAVAVDVEGSREPIKSVKMLKQHGSVEVRPRLLNEQERVVVELITDGEPSRIGIDARLKGQTREIRVLREPKNRYPHSWFAAGVIVLFTSISTFSDEASVGPRLTAGVILLATILYTAAAKWDWIEDIFDI